MQSLDDISTLVEQEETAAEEQQQLASLPAEPASPTKPDAAGRAVRFSFYITYAFLVTTATVTFIEAMRTKDALIRNVLNLETCISVVAAFFYGLFMDKLKQADAAGEDIDYKDINVNRYVDWSITTPIMLLVLALALCYNTGQSVTLGSFLLILVLNYGMLACGFAGENGLADKRQANVLGFVFFVALYGYLYATYVRGFNIFDNNILFGAFVVLWALYGVVYWMEERRKNVAYNVLDLFSKCFVGIFFWAYFTKAIVL
jgi:bacteriorhodopsin